MTGGEVTVECPLRQYLERDKGGFELQYPERSRIVRGLSAVPGPASRVVSSS